MAVVALMSRIADLSKKLLTLAVASLLALAAAEGLVRWIAPQQLIRLRPDIWIPDHQGLGWRMASGLDTRVNTGERDVRLRTDGDGHRIGIEPVASPQRRILALGDSFLAAIQVEYDDTMTARIEASLTTATGERVRVVNAGVGGWDPNHYLLKARDELSRDSYDLVLVFFFLGNDVIEEKRERFGPKSGEIIHSFRWPRSLGKRELVNAWLYPLNDGLERRSHIFLLFRHGAWNLLMRMGLSARHFPTADLKAEADSPRWQVTGELCADIASVGAAHGAGTLFVLLPGLYHVEPDLGLAYAAAVGLGPGDVDLGQSRRLVTAQLQARGLRFIDPMAGLRRLHEAGTPTHGRVDTHLSPAGHAEIARLLHEGVLETLGPRAQD